MNIIQSFLGRIGNEMFCITVGKYLAKKYNAKLYLVPHPNDISYMERMQDKMYPNMTYLSNFTGISNLKINNEVNSVHYTPIEMGNENTFIMGWRQCPKYWDNDKEFACSLWDKPEILEYIKELYNEYNLSEYVSINVRCVDHNEKKEGKIEKLTLGYQSMEYFNECINQFPEDTKFLITSNNLEWCKENFKGDNFIFADKEVDSKYGKELVDLYIQTLCKANIISNSTFSWWGAYLNKNAEVVYYPYPFFRFTWDMDIIPEDDKWKPINAQYVK